MFAKLTTINLELKTGTKTVYVETGKMTEDISREFYDNVFNACSFFRRLGGSEFVSKSWTKYGYIPVLLISKSPDRSIKVIRKFDLV